MNEKLIDEYLFRHRKVVFDTVMGERAGYPMIWHCWKFAIWKSFNETLKLHILTCYKLDNEKVTTPTLPIYLNAHKFLKDHLGKGWGKIREELEALEM